MDEPRFIETPVRDGWAELRDGGVVLASGVTVVSRRENPLQLPPPAFSVGLVLERNGLQQWWLMVDDGDGGSSSTSDPAGKGFTEFGQWLALHVRLHRGELDGRPVEPTFVTFTKAGALRPVGPHVSILDQRTGVDLGPAFAPPGARTAVAQVELAGTVWFVLARDIDESPQYIPATSKARSLEAFLAEARKRYASGEGMR